MLVPPTLLLAGCERTLNALLARDPAAPTRLAKLAGSRLLVKLEQPQLQLVLSYHAAGVDLLRGEDIDEATVDAVVELTTKALSQWLNGVSIERLMFEGQLAIRGRTHLLEATRDLFFDLDTDWEGELANWLGDTPAHSLAEGIRRFTRWGIRAKDEMLRDVSEYVFEEARILPGRQQCNVLRDHLTDLEIATDRLEARLSRLQQAFEKTTQQVQLP